VPLGVGLKLAQQETSPQALRAVWRIADEAGFDHLWCIDHPMGVHELDDDDIFDAWMVLAAMAEVTSHIRMGSMVTGNTYRHPGILAKMAATIDHFSGGRLEVGIGTGWTESEHTMLGLEFGTAGERIARLDEACTVLRALWTEERASFEGRYYTLRDAISNPKPLQRPYPRLWLGGRGERKMLRVVATHADVWNLTVGVDVDEAVRLSGVLDRHCDDIGRDPVAVARSVQFRFTGDVDAALAHAAPYVARGFGEVLVIVDWGENAERDAERVAADVLPRLRELG
jgi:F420-dependent oxidoreductase-like protein